MVQVAKKKTTKKYAAAAFPMLMIALSGSAIFMGDKALLSGMAPDPEKVPYYKDYMKKSSKAIEEEYEARRKRWWKHTANMPICNHVKAVCDLDGLLPRLRDSVTAGAKMRSSVMGIGGGPTSYLALLCAVIGIFFSEKLSKLFGYKKQQSDKESGGTGASSSTGKTTSATYHQPIKNKASDIEDQTSPIITRKESKDEKASSLYHPEVSSITTQDCLESPVVPSLLKRWTNNSMTYLSGTGFTWSNPVVTFKIFIALLLVIELNDLMAPEQTIFYTPEIIALQRAKPDPREHVPYMADLLTPSLSYATADLWYARLKMVRNVLVVSWLAYLVLPPKRMGGVCYVIGALLYCYLATIGLMYNLGHSMQGGILFLLSSIFAVPFLGCPKYGDRSARWLRRFLYIVVLVPIYLFSGVSKVSSFALIVCDVSPILRWIISLLTQALLSLAYSSFDTRDSGLSGLARG